MKVSVLVPSWRRPASLARCLDALEGQARSLDQLVLAVRADDEATRALISARSLPFPVEVATPDRPGVIAALNAGFDRADGEVVAVTDDDTAPHADWLEQIVARFEAEPGLGGIGGRDRIVGEGGDPLAGADLVVGRILWFGRVVGNHHLGSGEMRDVDILKGANMAVRRRALGDLRLDPAFRGSGAEHHWEIDLSLALKAAGWRLAYDPAIQVEHFEAARHGGQREGLMSPQERFNAIHNQTYALLKHLPWGRRTIAVSYGLLVGTRANPGPLMAPILIAEGRRLGEVAARTRTATAARLTAFRSWWRWRRER
jgi:GT2 family glycosyltransferase